MAKGDLFRRWIAECSRQVGAEIGVKRGKTAAALLRDEATTLYLIDPWEPIADDYYQYPAERHRDNYEQMLRATAFAHDRRLIVRSTSEQAAMKIDAMDFVILDANHRADAVLSDCRLWWPKVRCWLGGRHYPNNGKGLPSVGAGVDRFAAEIGREVEVDGNGWRLRK